MARPTEPLKPWDVLLYRNYGWLGDAIGWAESAQNGDSRYSHVAMVYPDLAQGFEQNPPCVHLFDLETVPWDRVDAVRLSVGGVDFFNDPQAVQASLEQATKLLHFKQNSDGTWSGEPYDYGFIAKALGVGLLEHIGLEGLAGKIMQQAQSTQHEIVCSNTAEVVANAGLHLVHPLLRLEPVWAGVGAMRPSDWPLSPLVRGLKTT
jgi:hypothetical protein